MGMDPATIGLIVSAGSGLIGSLAGDKGSRASGRTPAMQGLENAIANFYTAQSRRPTTYTPINPMNMNAANIMSSYYLGTPYSQPGLGQYSYPGQGGVSPYSMRQPSSVPSQLAGLAGGSYYRPR